MIRPESKLPFIFYEDIDDTTIRDSIDNLLSISSNTQDSDLGISSTKDAEFIVHACNNYEKMVQLLIRANAKLYSYQGHLDNNINNFLIEIGEIKNE